MPAQTAYDRVANDLREKIRNGTYQPGAQLPSRAKLREEYGVSGIVIDRAMFILRTEGLTETVPGVGVFVTERATPTG